MTPSCNSPSWIFLFDPPKPLLLCTHLYFVPSQPVEKLTFMECIKRFSCPLASDGIWQ